LFAQRVPCENSALLLSIDLRRERERERERVLGGGFMFH